MFYPAFCVVSAVDQDKPVIIDADSEATAMIAAVDLPAGGIFKFAFQATGGMNTLFLIIPGNQGGVFILQQGKNISHFSDCIKIRTDAVQG